MHHRTWIINRTNIFLENPDYWEYKLRKARVLALSDRNIDIFLEYNTGEGATLKSIGVKYLISPERVRQVNAFILRYIVRQNALKRVQEEIVEMNRQKTEIFKEEDYVPRRSRQDRPALRRDEYDQIKELLFRGEAATEIEAITGRHNSTIGRISRATSYEDYFNHAKTGKKGVRAMGEDISIDHGDHTEELSMDRLADLVAERIITKLIQRLVR